MLVKLQIELDLRKIETPQELLDALNPIVPTPLPDDLTVTITGLNTLTLSYSKDFPDALLASETILNFIRKALPQWYSAIYYMPPSP